MQPKGHYYDHKTSPWVSILKQLNPVHPFIFYFSMIHFNIILNLCLGLWSGL
jgi:hypothetical protein